MDWSGYEVWTLISGIVVLGVGLFGASLEGRERFTWAGIGMFCIVYAFYVASRTTGAYYFSVYIFAAPVAAVARAVFAARQKTSPE